MNGRPHRNAPVHRRAQRIHGRPVRHQLRRQALRLLNPQDLVGAHAGAALLAGMAVDVGVISVTALLEAWLAYLLAEEALA